MLAASTVANRLGALCKGKTPLKDLVAAILLVAC